MFNIENLFNIDERTPAEKFLFLYFYRFYFIRDAILFSYFYLQFYLQVPFLYFTSSIQPEAFILKNIYSSFVSSDEPVTTFLEKNGSTIHDSNVEPI